jgi:hypothetical protein
MTVFPSRTVDPKVPVLYRGHSLGPPFLYKKIVSGEGTEKNLLKRWLDYDWFILQNNWRIFVPNIWWISPLTYYTDLLPHWRHNKRDTYNECIFKIQCTILDNLLSLLNRAQSLWQVFQMLLLFFLIIPKCLPSLINSAEGDWQNSALTQSKLISASTV